MKKIALAATLLGLLTSTSMAADLPVKAPPVIVPVSIWNGFYAGVNAGYGWGSADLSEVGTGTSFGDFGPLHIPTSHTFQGAHNQKPNGALGGGQVGYNFQPSPKWILGLEADIQAANQQNTSTFTDPLAGTVCSGGLGPPPGTCSTTHPVVGAAVGANQVNLEWFGTVRGRAGLLVTDQTLLYATGGLAYGQFRASGNVTVSGGSLGGGNTVTFTGVPSAFAASTTNVGFAVGGGIEGKLTNLLPQNWSWKLEYLYIDLGSLNISTPFVSTGTSLVGNFSNMTGTMNSRAHFTDNVVRMGINYRFN